MTSPRVSVILPVFNGEQFIKLAIDTVAAQTYRDFELLVIDDGSTDRTREFLDAMETKATVLFQRNAGVYTARNLGLQHAKGELIAFLDADDRWHPERLARQIPLIDADRDIGLVFGNGVIERMGREGKPTLFDLAKPSRGRVFSLLVRKNFVTQSSVLVRKRCFEEFGLFKEMPLAADYHKWLQIASRYKIDFIQEPVFTYTLHGSNISAKRAAQIQCVIQLFDDLVEHPPIAGVSALLAKRRLELEFQCALVQARDGVVRWARAIGTPADGMNWVRRSFCFLSVAVTVARRSGRRVLLKE